MSILDLGDELVAGLADEVVTRVRELLAEPASWAKMIAEVVALDGTHCYCLTGAIDFVSMEVTVAASHAGYTGPFVALHEALIDRVSRALYDRLVAGDPAIRALSRRPEVVLRAWNDDPRRQHADVTTLLDAVVR